MSITALFTPTFPAWKDEVLLKLDGHILGALLRNWGMVVNRQFGSGSSEALRQSLGITEEELPDSPSDKAWFPVSWQLGLSQKILMEHLDGDLHAFADHLEMAALSHESPKHLRFLKRFLSPKLLLSASPKIHQHFYDFGHCQIQNKRHSSILYYRESAVFTAPIWQAMQVIALKGYFKAMKAKMPDIELKPLPLGLEIRLHY